MKIELKKMELLEKEKKSGVDTIVEYKGGMVRVEKAGYTSNKADGRVNNKLVMLLQQLYKPCCVRPHHQVGRVSKHQHVCIHHPGHTRHNEGVNTTQTH